jgi:hypothetical protein
MNISFNTDFPGLCGRALQSLLKSHYGLRMRICLDGEPVSKVVRFSIPDQRLERLVEGEDGQPMAHAGKVVTETLRGKVTVELVDTGEVPPCP